MSKYDFPSLLNQRGLQTSEVVEGVNGVALAARGGLSSSQIADALVNGGGTAASVVGYTISDAGFTDEEYVATPIAVLNATLLYMKQFGGGTLTLPYKEITVKVGEETKPEGWAANYYKVIIPAESGLSYTIKGHGKEFPINIDTSLLTGAETTSEWHFIEVGDQDTGRGIWTYVSLADGVTDVGAYNYDTTKMLDLVYVSNVYIKGDEPDASSDLTAVGAYAYQVGGIRIGAAKLAIADKVEVHNTLNSGLVVGFYEMAYVKDCKGSNIGYRKYSGQPANFLDLIGLGSGYYDGNGIKSVVFVENCYADRIHDVAYMGIWTDVYLNNSSCDKTAIAVEHQEQWAVTSETNLGGDWYISNCKFNCNTYGLITSGTELKLGDAIVANGGCSKTMLITDTIIDRAANMAVSCYAKDYRTSVVVRDCVIKGCGWAGYTEYPLLLISEGHMHVSGGRIDNCNKDLTQQPSGGTLSWGDRTDVINCTRGVTTGKYEESLCQIKLNFMDSNGYCFLGSSSRDQSNYDLDFRFVGSTKDAFIKLTTADSQAVRVSGKIKLDMNNACPDLRPIVSTLVDNHGCINLEVVNFNYKSANTSGWNCSYGYINTSSNLYINGFKPTQGTILGVDFNKVKATSGSGMSNLDSAVSNIRQAYLTKDGLNLNQLSCLGDLQSTYPYTYTNFLQVDSESVSSCLPSTGWTVVIETDGFDYINNTYNNLTRVKTLLYAMQNSSTTSSNTITLQHWDTNGRDEIYVSIGGASAFIDQEPTVGKIMVALSYDGSTTAVLSVNGRSKSFTVGSLPDFTQSTSVIYIGSGSTALASTEESFDPKSGNCNLRKLGFMSRYLSKNMLDILTGLVK